MQFSFQHDFDDLYALMAQEKVFAPNTINGILRKAGTVLIRELEATAPDSLRSYAKSSSNAGYSKKAEASRAKYGEMNKALGIYKSKGQAVIGGHAINVGYLPSKQDKAFVSNFLNYGWKSSNGVMNLKHFHFMQKAELKVLPQMKDIFDKEVEKTFETYVAQKWRGHFI